MKYCPLISFQRDYSAQTQCMWECAFKDEAGECLIKQALQCYVQNTREKNAKELEKLENQTRLLQLQMQANNIINHNNHNRITAIEDELVERGK